MATRLPASQREELQTLIEGRLSTASGTDELVKLAARLIVEAALEGEAADAIGRDCYEHGAQPGQGHRNGYRIGRPKTAAGLMDSGAANRLLRNPTQSGRYCATIWMRTAAAIRA
jgi:hypothetical protein